MAKCMVPTCSKNAVARRVCKTHYTRLRLYGDPNFVKEHHYCGLTVAERFGKYVKKTDTCWLWIGSKCPKGYGRMNVKGKSVIAPRISWKIHYGGIPQGKYVLHKCDNPSCVNPDHLYLGNQYDNMADMYRSGRAKHKRGEENGKSKLTEAIVREIRTSTNTLVALARKFGINRRTVWSVQSRKTWRHID